MSSAPRSAAVAGPLLAFERVGKSYPDGRQRIVVLKPTSFELHRGEHMGVLGPPRAGKSTLLRLAAGVELPDEGRIEFEGRDMVRAPAVERERLLRHGIGLVASDDWRPAKGERVVDLVALPLLSDGATLHEARRSARRILNWAGATDYADDPAAALAIGERFRVMLARALVREPRLLLVDEPAVVPSFTERAELYPLLRAGARACNAALVVASVDGEATKTLDTLVSIGYGELTADDGERGVVLPFPPQRPPGGLERSGS
ncbi:MAG TPA: ATP-binding cassette domain-containing protein [Solirubrobacteraceae bacterium]|jgi:ABC-type lipoprotein export system ATPase subunit|nr:ATP-binding cassette domain-containing protein [Solirubrobacteraceae bacterium]